MARTALQRTGYAALRQKVRETLLRGQQSIEEEKVRTYWHTGKLIHEHILEYRHRADYGKQTLEKLSKDLDVDKTLLDRTLRFYRVFPKIVAARQQLTWAHYRALITVPDAGKRTELARLAAKNSPPSRELEIKIRNLNWSRKISSDDAVMPKLTRPELGNFWTYRVIRPELVNSRAKALLLDLGFQATIELDHFENAKFKEGDIVTSVKDKDGKYKLSLRGANGDEAISGPLYTYQAFVERVIDGDTLKVEIDLGFKLRFRLTLRLRGIDAYEMDSSEGRRAKAFVEEALKHEASVTIKSTRDDKYGRYLADVFYGPRPSHYLNQILLDEKLAVKV